jgi:hypothetical protein
MTEIDVWYGDSDRRSLEPIKDLLLKFNQNGPSEIQITDKVWLDNMGLDEDYKYIVTYEKLPDDYFVSYDAYAWCYPGECSLNTKWW